MITAVIGAGASGIMAAICAARKGDSVVVYEHRESAANKILITGNGKCNFTNLRMEPSCFHSSSDSSGRIGRILERFDTGACISFFEELGIKHRERRGCIYPYTDTAESVKSALMLELKRLGVRIIYDCDEIQLSGDRKVNKMSYDRVIIACGSCVSKRTGSDGSGYGMVKKLGIGLTDIYPALTPLILKEDVSSLRGVRCEASLRLINEEGEVAERSEGELQPFETGFSGICAMDISGQACRILGRGERAYIETDFLPVLSDGEFTEEIIRRRERFPERKLSELMTGLFPKKLINYLVHPIDTRRENHITEFVLNVKHHIYELSPDMTRDFSRAQTAAGGIPIDSIDDSCMLTGHKGIYAVGELLDADGICGGYNLHFAWATGSMAGGSLL